MVHTISGLGLHLALDVESGSLHLLDGAAAFLLPHFETQMNAGGITSILPIAVRQAGKEQFPEAELKEAWAELQALFAGGQIFAAPADVQVYKEGVLKAMCLHISHDCDLRCGYCFAKTGHYGQARSVMPLEVARQAIDYLVRHSGSRRNLEIDFFGGEPLLAMDTVRETVSYARRFDKNFRFTLTTNGLALDKETEDYLLAEMDNVVLSLDGRPDTHNAVRKTAMGQGSYDEVVPKILSFVRRRTEDCAETDAVPARPPKRSYYIRGTFTAQNPNFVEDLLHLYRLGFSSLSMEPVVLRDGHPLALSEQHADQIEQAYEELMLFLDEEDARSVGELDSGSTCATDTAPMSFFHFNLDLSQGPCLTKRLRGCGAGTEYVAVTPEGEVYPCHQFVGNPDFLLGRLGGDGEIALDNRLGKGSVQEHPECRGCWAKYYCSGGCAAANYNMNGDVRKNYELSCRLEKKRLSCALILAVKKQLRRKP